MFISEFVEIFQAISDKLFSGSVVTAVDCATIFGFGHPNLLTIGFLFGVIGQVIAIMGLIVFRSPVIAISGFIPLFFDNATFAVFAYKKGGLKASIIIPLLSGFIQIACGTFAAYYFGLAHFGGYSGNFDWVTLWPAVAFLMDKLQYIGVVIALIAMLLIPQIQYLKNKKGYFKIAEDYEGYLEDKENNK
jgi:PTS system ascorbate-specific IIC component